MIALFARPGRESQRYEKGHRLVAGCIPYRYTKTGDTCEGASEETLEVLMVTPYRGDGLVFPKGAWENHETKEEAACREALEEAGVKGDIKDFLGSWKFISRRHRDEHSPEGFREGYMFALHVTEELDSWPEKDVRQRKWVSVTEAMGLLRHGWMKEALKKSETFCLRRRLQSPLSESVDGSESSVSLSQSSDEDPSEQSACDEDDLPRSPKEESPTSVKLRKPEVSSQSGCCSSSYVLAIALHYNEELKGEGKFLVSTKSMELINEQQL